MTASQLHRTRRGPLAGVKVVEIAGIGPGPFCGMLLADLGADVVLVERPLPEGPAGEIADAGILRRGRRSLVADLKNPDAVAAVLRLVASADIVFEGMRPGVAERLGIGPDACLAANPRVVYGRMTGWGQDGPLAARAGHDLNYISITGVLHAIGREGPVAPLNLVGDFGGGAMFLAVGMLAALAHARATGEGQVVDAAMYEGANLLMTMFWEQFAQGRFVDERASNVLDGGAPFNDVYRCSDDRWLAVAAIEPQFRHALLTTLELPFDDEDLGLDRARWPTLRAALTATFATRPRDEWIALLGELDACVSPVLSLDEAPEHPHAVARAAFLPAPEGVQPAPAPRFSATPPGAPPPPPPRGAHTDEVLAAAGFDASEITVLRSTGAVR
jgi:alpha-methylacyl-CoA racemase